MGLGAGRIEPEGKRTHGHEQQRSNSEGRGINGDGKNTIKESKKIYNIHINVYMNTKTI